MPSMVEQLRLLAEWAPMLGYARRYAATDNPQERALVAADAAEWLASKTASKLDDRLVRHAIAILKTNEGAALVRDLVSIVDSLPKEPNP